MADLSRAGYATRYGKLALSFLPFVHLACTLVWLA